MIKTDDLRIKEIRQLLPPIALIEKYPLSEKAARITHDARQAIHRMLHGEDARLLVVIGPCSIHDTAAAMEYAERLLPLRGKYREALEIVMRVYFEKPRTQVGWKGFLNDPYLDGSFHINDGLRMARRLLLEINTMGLPVAVEYLDMITPQYIADMVAWGAIGARTTESQVHRQLASGLSCPVGFKNGTNGNTQIAVDAINSARAPHSFLSVTKFGHSAIVETTGNEDTHLILRGGREPNYSAKDVAAVETLLGRAGLAKKIMIDCSHANADKRHERQTIVADDVCRQRDDGNTSIFGLMVESHLVSGRQKLVDGKAKVYGQSITDACIGWEETELLLAKLAQNAAKKRA